MLGNFHLELAFCGVIGTFINESGTEYLLTEYGVLDEGSLMGFIRGKYYNRCVRIHDILALVMERKIYDTFMSTLTQEMKDALNDLLSNVPQDCGTQEQFLETSPIFQQHMGEFDVYLKKAMDGDLGPTAQYWSMYVHMVNRVDMDLMRTLHTTMSMATSRYCQPRLIYFWTKSTKLCALGCHISQPASEGNPTESSGAPVRGLFHKMHGKEFFTINYRLGIGTDCQ